MNGDLTIFGIAVPVLVLAVMQLAKVLGLDDDKKKAVLSVVLGVAFGVVASLLAIYPEAKPILEVIFQGFLAGLTAGGFYTAQKVLRS